MGANVIKRQDNDKESGWCQISLGSTGRNREKVQDLSAWKHAPGVPGRRVTEETQSRHCVRVYLFISRNFLCSADHSEGKTWVLEMLVIKPQLLPIQHLCVRPGAPWRVGMDFHPQSYLGVPRGSWSSSHRVPGGRKEGGDPSPSPLRLAGQVQPHRPTRASAGRPGNVTQLRARVSWLKKKGTVGI